MEIVFDKVNEVVSFEEISLFNSKDTRYYMCSFHNAPDDGETIILDRCIFEHVDFGDCLFDNVKFVDCTFRFCNFDYMAGHEVLFSNCEFYRCGFGDSFDFINCRF